MSKETNRRIPNAKAGVFINYRLLLILIGCWFLPAVVQGHDWPMWKYDAGRSAATPEELPARLNLFGRADRCVIISAVRYCGRGICTVLMNQRSSASILGPEMSSGPRAGWVKVR